jgi:hypothetical protein
MSEVDDSKFPHGYVPEHLKKRVKIHKNLPSIEPFNLIAEMSEAPWTKIGVVRNPSERMDKTIRRVELKRL